ncbi:unnamed protein product, partial [Acanthoscelides obtectus]
LLKSSTFFRCITNYYFCISHSLLSSKKFSNKNWYYYSS